MKQISRLSEGVTCSTAQVIWSLYQGVLHLDMRHEDTGLWRIQNDGGIPHYQAVCGLQHPDEWTPDDCSPRLRCEECERFQIGLELGQ